MAMQFEWDETKAEANLEKHGITFDEAITVFGDPLSVTIHDSEHSLEEDRYVDIGKSLGGHLLVVVYAEREDRIRIISCRQATAREREQHERGKPDSGRAGEMIPEYDFSGGVRGKHAEAWRRGFKVVVHRPDGTTEERDFALPDGAVILDPDVREAFPDSESVNRALRGLLALVPSR